MSTCFFDILFFSVAHFAVLEVYINSVNYCRHILVMDSLTWDLSTRRTEISYIFR